LIESKAEAYPYPAVNHVESPLIEPTSGVPNLMNRLALWLDNPILVKHSRSRLRRMPFLTSIAVVMIIALSIVLLGYQYDGLHGGGTFGGLMMSQVIILGFMGASQVGSSVGKARESGILDFHRASPLPPISLALGFFFGAPIREYAMFAATLPFSLVCVFMGRPSPVGFIQLMVPLVMAAWVMHAIALLNALSGKGGSVAGKAGARGVVGLVMFLIFGGAWFVQGFIMAADAVTETPLGSFYGIRLPWLVILALDLFPAIGFLMVASTRKLASERAHALSKPQAIACLATGAVLLLGGLWGIEMDFAWTLVVLYGLIIGSIVMILAITPGRDEFAKGIRKAAKEGRKYPSAWSDRGLNRLALFSLCGVVLVAPTVAWRAIERPIPWMMQGQEVSYSLSIAIGVLVVAYFGLALQYFQLRFGKRGSILLSLFLFAVWLLPLACGAIAAAAAAQRRTPDTPPDIWSPAIASLSPIFGIAVSSGLGNLTGLQAARAAALLPALAFALLFNNLVTSTRRRIEKAIHPEPSFALEDKAKADALAEPVLLP
jgi:hypothetical protein